MMENRPLFFLFTCVYNGKQWIGKLFDSLINQTKHNFIHYIYEDGSSDPLGELVNNYIEKAHKLEDPYTVIYENNSVNIGLNLATKHCIDKCTADYFIWIDCDNWVDADFFNNLEKCVLKNPDAIYISTNRIDYRNNKRIPYFTKKSLKLAKKKRRDIEFLCTGYKYSFFAVNLKKYLAINPNNHFSKNRYFFNDVQVISHCIFSNYDFAFAQNAFSCVLLRNQSEGNILQSRVERCMQKYKTIEAIAKVDGWEYVKAIPLIRDFKLLEYTIDRQYADDGYKCCKKSLGQMEIILSSKYLPKSYSKFLKNKLAKWKLLHRNKILYKIKLYVGMIMQRVRNFYHR